MDRDWRALPPVHHAAHRTATGPILLVGAPLGHFLLKLLLHLQQPKVFGVFRDRVVLQTPTMNLHIVFVSQCIDKAAIIELRSPARPKI